MWINWADVKRRQADEADKVAAVAAGIGEYEIANACYRLAGILREQAAENDRQAREGTPLCRVLRTCFRRIPAVAGL